MNDDEVPNPSYRIGATVNAIAVEPGRSYSAPTADRDQPRATGERYDLGPAGEEYVKEAVRRNEERVGGEIIKPKT
ncbi:hypothetical protein HDU85_006273, partial [Gaertneriomyces sp. JEL0708]